MAEPRALARQANVGLRGTGDCPYTRRMATRQTATHRGPASESGLGGRHLLIECFGEQAGFDAAALEALLRRAALAGGATVLSCHMHGFGGGQGVTGVALLAESHITVHTWPERGYAAFDVFMCGACNADRAAAVIADAVPQATVQVSALDRPSGSAIGHSKPARAT